MSAPRRSADEAVLHRVRRRWRLRTLAVGLGRATLAAAVVAALLLAADAALDLSRAARALLRWSPLLALGAPTIAAAVRAARAPTPERVALLVDEAGGAGNVFSTLLRPNAAGPVADAFRARAAARLAELSRRPMVPVAPRSAWAPAAAGVVVLLATLGPAAGGGWLAARWIELAEAPAGSAGAAAAAGTATDGRPRLGAVEWVVRPPAYTGLPARSGGADAPLAALPGSVVELRGPGRAGPGGLRAAVVGGDTLRVAADGGGWSVGWTVAPVHQGVTLEVRDGARVAERRVLPLRILRDRPPTVELAEPERDVVVARAAGVVRVHARARDDHGVDALTLHWIRSRGSGESFDFEEGTWTWDAEGDEDGARTGTRALRLDELGLAPGDVLHVRATATDLNDVTGPGRGASATRQIRVADEDDLAEVTTLVGFPIEREREPLLSQRMIILLTEELREGSPGMGRPELLEAAAEIADEQRRLRMRMGEQIFSRATGAMQDPEGHLEFEEGEGEAFVDALEGQVREGPLIDPETGIATISDVDIVAHEHDSDPIVAVNRSLLTVYNLMWDAERELRTAALDASLVAQHRALDELQRLREGERVFARGRVGVAPVDVAAARGGGELDDAEPARREPPPPADGAPADVAARLDAMLASGEAPVGPGASVVLSGLVLDLLAFPRALEASEALSRASARAEAGDVEGVRSSLREARRALLRGRARAGAAAPAPRSLAGARYAAAADSAARRAPGPSGPHGRPFVFATARYGSGDWDSAPLVPANLIHSLAQYTEIDVAPQGVVVDLASPEVLEYPFLYLTGHLPVFFDEAESRNLVAFVERGGLVFIDDHNHDIDGAFHRTATAELRRLFGGGSLVPVPADHPLYRAFFAFEDGPPITGHELSGWGDGLIHRELFQVEVGGRMGVLYSNKDYSSEWSYHPENKRFLAVDNTRFGVNILVYALTR